MRKRWRKILVEAGVRTLVYRAEDTASSHRVAAISLLFVGYYVYKNTGNDGDFEKKNQIVFFTYGWHSG